MSKSTIGLDTGAFERSDESGLLTNQKCENAYAVPLPVVLDNARPQSASTAGMVASVLEPSRD